MFFNYIVLYQRHDGRLGIAWIAATRGANAVGKKALMDFNTSRACDDLCKYVMSKSKEPNKRLSLRMSSMLISGIIRIHGRKALKLLDDLATALTLWSAPVIIRSPVLPAISLLNRGQQHESSDDFQDTPPTPVIGTSIKSKKRPRRKTIPKKDDENEGIQVITDVDSLITARQEEIVLHEADFGPSRTDIGRSRDEEGFGILTEAEFNSAFGAINLPLDRSKSVLVPQMPSRLSDDGFGVVVAQVHASADGENVPLPQLDEGVDEIVGGTKRKTSDVPAAMDAIEIIPEEHRGSPPARQLPITPTRPPALAQRDVRDDEVQLRLPMINPRYLVRTKRSRRFAKINRASLIDLTSIKTLQVPSLTLQLKSFDLESLLQKFHISESLGAEIPVENVSLPTITVTPSTSIDRGRSLATPSLDQTPLGEIAITSEAMDKDGHVLKKRRLLGSSELARMTASPGEQLEISGGFPIQEQTIHEILPPEEPLPQVHSIQGVVRSFFDYSSDFLVEKSALHRREVHEVSEGLIFRRQALINRILDCDVDAEMTLDDLCVPPIRKSQVVAVFTDLLDLCKAGYVLLHHGDNSTALKNITRGPKLPTS